MKVLSDIFVYNSQFLVKYTSLQSGVIKDTLIHDLIFSERLKIWKSLYRTFNFMISCTNKDVLSPM